MSAASNRPTWAEHVQAALLFGGLGVEMIDSLRVTGGEGHGPCLCLTFAPGDGTDECGIDVRLHQGLLANGCMTFVATTRSRSLGDAGETKWMASTVWGAIKLAAAGLERAYYLASQPTGTKAPRFVDREVLAGFREVVKRAVKYHTDTARDEEPTPRWG